MGLFKNKNTKKSRKNKLEALVIKLFMFDKLKGHQNCAENQFKQSEAQV
jgi:hypothetical protein